MSAFKKEEFVPVVPTNLTEVGNDIVVYFQQQGYTATIQPSMLGTTTIDIEKTGIFRTVLGMKTALKLSLEPRVGGTQIIAEVGVWGQQVAPTAVMLFIFWPVILTQIWGLVQKSNMDDEAVRVARETLYLKKGTPLVGTAQASVGKHCVQCGRILPEIGKFCPGCGTGYA